MTSILRDRRSASLLLAFALLLGCGAAPRAALDSPSDTNGGHAPSANLGTVEGNVVLEIPAKLVSLGDDLAKVHVLGSDRGTNIGFDVEITSRAVTIHSTGANSDALLATLARAYSATPPSPHMRAKLEFPIEYAEGDLKSADRSLIKLKTTIDTGLKSEYAEIFLTFDATRNAFSIVEKDPSFRTNVVRAFSQ